ncbi:site-specific integrase [Cytobacillus oceanisediminis]|uniref:tyrosine-type recombinase/integrase n=1 Tax=Cytobacillus oceanisediminis TaxID=665099 RepID=UPI00203BAE4A|nr:site-specific integrase [Cytobacillus oceanisediminis]MCM3527882.1 site-specific integrase [Cytobacillus oceanisediminis]
MATLHKYKKKGSNKDFWEYRIYYQDPITRKTREKSKKGFTSKPEAKLAAEEAERLIREGYEMKDESLKSYLKNWLLEYKKGTVSKNTLELHERNIKNHILPYFKNILLKDLKPIMYQKFINHLTDKGYSKRTVEIIHGTLHNAYDKAILLGKIEKNPCSGVTIKGKQKEKGEIKFIEAEHIADFLRTAYEYGYIYWIFYKVLIETGLRKGEAAALQWTDVDLKNKTININKSLDFQEASKDKENIFGDVKTYHSKRTISISHSLANDLNFHKKYQNQNKTALNENYHFDLNLVLCRNDGNYMPKSSLFNSFSRILKKCDLPSLPIHSLRHTHAVLQLEAGADMKYIQERLGHGSIQITADVYSHISKKIETERMSKFEEYMKNVLE